jgi:16S rRNA processing protein RimM
MTENTRILLGIITGMHGLKGMVKIKSFTEDPLAIAEYSPLTDKHGRKEYKLETFVGPKGSVLAKVEGVTDRNGAEALKGTELYTLRENLAEPEEEDEFYIEDLIGLQVVLENGAPFGIVRSVQNFGAGDLVEVKPEQGNSEFYAFTLANFPDIDLAAGTLTFSPPELLSGQLPKEEA